MKHQTPFDAVEKVRPQLSEADSSQLWDSIAQALPTTTPVASPFRFSWFSSSYAVPLALVMMVVMGVGSLGTFAAAESAKPGDFLFPVERAIEELRISLASDTRAEVLRDEFARKRLVEIQALIDAELARLEVQNSTSSLAIATATTAVSAAARIRIDTGINELFGLVNGLKTLETRNQIVTELKTTVNDLRIREDDDEYRLRVLNDGTRLEVRGDGDDERIEIRKGDERVRVRIKDGEVRTEVKSNKDDDRDDKKEDDSRNRGVQTPTLRILKEVEAEVFTDVTVVTIERRDGDDVSFTTSARTKVEIIAEVAARTGVTTDEVDAVLEIDYENRAYRKTDTAPAPTTPTTTPEREGNGLEATTATTIKKIDVDVERTVAKVEVEYRDGKNERFTLAYTTKALLVTELALRLGFNESVVSSALRLEIDND